MVQNQYQEDGAIIKEGDIIKDGAIIKDEAIIKAIAWSRKPIIHIPESDVQSLITDRKESIQKEDGNRTASIQCQICIPYTISS